MIEKAMAEVGFSVKADKTAKSQVSNSNSSSSLVSLLCDGEEKSRPFS